MKKRDWLINLRKEAGYKNQSQFADVVKLSKSYISEIESGNRTPSGDKAYKISRILNFDMERFYEDAQ